MKSTYKLHYFEGNGRAVNIRAILDYTNSSWEDNKVTFADWPALKASGEEDEYQILNIISTREDYSKHLYGLLFANEEQKTKRDEIIKNLNENVFPPILISYERRYLENGKGKYFLGDKFSLADIFLATGFTQLFESSLLKDIFFELPTKYAPSIVELVQRVKQTELKEFFEKSYLHNSTF